MLQVTKFGARKRKLCVVIPTWQRCFATWSNFQVPTFIVPSPSPGQGSRSVPNLWSMRNATPTPQRAVHYRGVAHGELEVNLAIDFAHAQSRAPHPLIVD